MWELHLQESGGIVGHEMGFGKTGMFCRQKKLKQIITICLHENVRSIY